MNEEMQNYIIKEVANIQKLVIDMNVKADRAKTDLENGTINEDEYTVAVDEATNKIRQGIVRLKFVVANFETLFEGYPTEVIEWWRDMISAMEMMLQ